MTGFKYMGKFKGKETLPVRENPPSNAVKFKEFDDPKIMGIVLSILSAIVMIGLYFLLKTLIVSFSTFIIFSLFLFTFVY